MTPPHADICDGTGYSAGTFVLPARLRATTDALRSLYAQPDKHTDDGHFLEQICNHAVDIIDSAHHAGITVAESDSTHRTVAATDDLVHSVDELQFQLGVGPAVESAHASCVVHAHSSEANRRWPQFAGEARRAGVSSFLSAPLPGQGQPLGTLNLYSRDQYGFTDADAAIIELFALTAYFALRSSHRLELARARTRDLELALESRGVIEQAKGIIMGTRHVTADDAFSLLIQESQMSNIKLRVVAQQHIAAAINPSQANADTHDTRPSAN
ncbi:ANTAR domain-containing protein [Rhodococcus globerulus]|uniref:ANTAR domain-containing protein n=1 Tax=Rhodococcus globerulus TaxID=33008 RepID=UPI0039ED752C